VSGRLHTPAALPPGEDTSTTHIVGDWMNLRTEISLEEQKNSFGFEVFTLVTLEDYRFLECDVM
jgi:hypothetical protein